MKRSQQKLKLKLNRETLATLDRAHLRFAGGDCTCSGCTNCTCCPTCAGTCTCPETYISCDTCVCATGRETDCNCI